MNITKEEYIKAKKIVSMYENHLYDFIDTSFDNLEKNDKLAIHEVLFNLDILELNDDNKVKDYYINLPSDIKIDGKKHGFNDSLVMDKMNEWFKIKYNLTY